MFDSISARSSQISYRDCLPKKYAKEVQFVLLMQKVRVVNEAVQENGLEWQQMYKPFFD